VTTTRRDGGDDIFDALRNHDPDRDLPIDRGIVSVESSTACVEAHLPFDAC
jgi:hypothetical protein